ncbi:malonyl CoA-acyl carrier protein transacylase isoform X2 [Ostrinia nubilalis]|uniref:malonyl CoA-acyl carrier protein transacylase isoform X2 n=1 Tax=Ostrinia nubilalis TaxID=29057 RepID=UPI00308256E8
MLARRVIRRSRVFCSLHVSYTKRSKGTQSNSVDSPLRQLLNDSSGFAEATTLEPELQWATQPYAARAPGQAETSLRVDPQETSVLLFPGQGSQKVGMGRELLKFPAAKDLYDLASSVVGWDVRKVCVEGPAEELDRRCQTAVLVTSLAALERARDERPAALQRVRAVAGFSLGEITALVFAGSLTFEGAEVHREERVRVRRKARGARPRGGRVPHAADGARGGGGARGAALAGGVRAARARAVGRGRARAGRRGRGAARAGAARDAAGALGADAAGAVRAAARRALPADAGAGPGRRAALHAAPGQRARLGPLAADRRLAL